jgi:hypothetical protein
MNRAYQVASTLVARLRGAPGTLIYLCSLLVTQLTLNTVDEYIGRRLVLSESTNLHNMAQAPVQVLIGSAFWVATSPVLTYLGLVALLLVMVAVERWLGTFRWLVTVSAGHIGATLLTVVVTAYALSHGLVMPKIAHITDVGFSYGLFAAAGVLTYRFPGWVRRSAWVLAVLSGLAVAAVLDHRVGDLGHVCAFLIGLGMWVLTRRARSARSVVPALSGEEHGGRPEQAEGRCTEQPAQHQRPERVPQIQLRDADREHDGSRQPAEGTPHRQVEFAAQQPMADAADHHEHGGRAGERQGTGPPLAGRDQQSGHDHRDRGVA